MNESQKLKKKDQQRIYTVFQLGEVQKLAKVKLTYSGKRQNGDQPGDGGWGDAKWEGQEGTTWWSLHSFVLLFSH